MSRLHLSWQVVLCVGLMQLAALALAALVLFHNAREAVEVEMAAAEAGARAQVIAAMGAALRNRPPEQVMAELSETLIEPRHVRIGLTDARTGALPVIRAESRLAHETAPHRRRAPGWFRDLVMPANRETRMSVLADGTDYGTVSIATAPEDEIDEVWEDAAALLWALALGFGLTGVLLVLLIRRALGPLDRLRDGLGALRGGALHTRLPEVPTPDFRPLADGFNALADNLEASEADRAALARKIVELGDHERRTIAMELQDEFGPCLFDLKVKAGAIQRAAARAGDTALQREAATLSAIVDQIHTANTRLLTTLRPMTLGQLPLLEALGDMLDGFRSTHGNLDWTIELPDRLPETEEIVDLTAYSFVQEGVTNALRHGRPDRLRVEVRPEDLPGQPKALCLTVEDDGVGLPDRTVEGRGLTAMRDRVRALGGTLELGRRRGGGTRLSAILPLTWNTSSRAEAAPAG
ncbi:ATP-binding protein [Rhodovulum sp. YEN HP10]|uniref:ATP-binding protein n=1 Tax=Rhodovulum sp. HP10 TaxID=3387397 RepID=UPI0039E1310E